MTPSTLWGIRSQGEAVWILSHFLEIVLEEKNILSTIRCPVRPKLPKKTWPK